MKQEIYIYAPGLGSKKLVKQQLNILKHWATEDSKVILLNTNWHDKSENYKDKKNRLIHDIEKILKQNDATFCIFGSSAGGSLALNLFNSLWPEIVSCICICGKIRNPQTLGDNYKNRAPALYDCVVESNFLADSLKPTLASNTLTLRPFFDEIVNTNDTKIKGTKTETIPAIGHFLSIGFSLLFQKNKIKSWHKESIKTTNSLDSL